MPASLVVWRCPPCFCWGIINVGGTTATRPTCTWSTPSSRSWITPTMYCGWTLSIRTANVRRTKIICNAVTILVGASPSEEICKHRPRKHNRHDGWEIYDFYKTRYHFKCKAHARDQTKPLPSLEDWQLFRDTYKEVVDDITTALDDPVPPTMGYTLVMLEKGLRQRQSTPLYLMEGVEGSSHQETSRKENLSWMGIKVTSFFPMAWRGDSSYFLCQDKKRVA